MTIPIVYTYDITQLHLIRPQIIEISRVNNWIKKMMNKSLDGSWQIGIGTAGTLLADAIKGYYGM